MGNQTQPTSAAQTPKWELPDAWAKSGHCPACGATNLKVTHLPDYPDYLSCTHCQVSFEVENGGRLIRIKYLPDEYEFADGVLHNRWVAASSLAGILNKNKTPSPVSIEKKEDPKPLQSLSDAEAWKRALGMYRLGNKPKLIQLSLMQSGMTQEQADVIFEKLRRLAEQDAQKQSQKFWMLAGISIFLILSLTGGWLYASGNFATLFNPATPVPLADQPSTMERLLDLVPDEAKPAIMDLPQTVAETGRGPAESSCPANATDAAELFGGNSALWRRDSQFPAWQMINPGSSITVSVPEGMTAAYVDNKTFEFLSVHGPATLYNANFVVISC